MNRKLLITTLLISGLMVTGCGNKSSDNEPQVQEQIVKTTIDFKLPEAHYNYTQYNEGHIEDFKKTYLNNDIFNKNVDPTLVNVLGGSAQVGTKFLGYVRLGSSKSFGSFSLPLNTEVVKEVKSIELEIYPYLISYTDYQTGNLVSKLEHATVGLSEDNLKTIPDNGGTSLEDLKSSAITFDENDCKDITTDLTLTTGYGDSEKGGGRIYLKNLTISYLEK